MNKAFNIVNSEHIEQVHRHLLLLPLDGSHEVTIRPAKKKRTLPQNALMWLWETIIGADLGNSKEDQHEWSKEQFLIPILCTDLFDANGEITYDGSEWRETVEAVKECRRIGANKEADALKKMLVNLATTTQCNKAQMTSFMNCLSRHAAALGIRLPAAEEQP